MSEGAKRRSVFAIDAILDRIGPMMVEIPGVLANEDTEPLHRMRVASRRLRAALSLLGASTGRGGGKFYRAVRGVTRALGAARDVDVHILWLTDFARGVPDEARPGAERLLLRLRQQRQALQPKVAKRLSELTDSPALFNAIERLRAARIDAVLGGCAEKPEDARRFTRLICLQVDSVIQHASSLLSEEAHEAQHRMRIEVKRLRYTLEILSPLYGELLNEYILLCKKLQGLLGDLHDADVWVDSIPELAESERRRTERYFGSDEAFANLLPGYRAVAADRSASRDEQYRQIVKQWAKLTEEASFESLKDTLVARHRIALYPGQDLGAPPQTPLGTQSPDPEL